MGRTSHSNNGCTNAQRIQKTKSNEANLDDSGAEFSEKAGYKTPEPIGRQKRKRSRSAVKLGENFHPLHCHPQNLWHLRFSHSSATMIQKLKSIKSNFDSTNAMSAYEQNKPISRIIRSKRKQSENS